MCKIVLRGHKVVGGKAEGEALVTRDCISFMGGVDPKSGIITEKGHELEGKKITGKILVFPSGKGSTGGSYMVYEMTKLGTAPKAIINIKADPIVAIGAIMGKIPLVDRLERNPIEVIRTGDYVIVNADEGLIEVYRKSKNKTDTSTTYENLK